MQIQFNSQDNKCVRFRDLDRWQKVLGKLLLFNLLRKNRAALSEEVPVTLRFLLRFCFLYPYAIRNGFKVWHKVRKKKLQKAKILLWKRDMYLDLQVYENIIKDTKRYRIIEGLDFRGFEYPLVATWQTCRWNADIMLHIWRHFWLFSR